MTRYYTGSGMSSVEHRSLWEALGAAYRCGWPADGDPMWARDASGELACSVGCSRWLDEQRARVEEHYRARREEEERFERGFRLAREARARREGGGR